MKQIIKARVRIGVLFSGVVLVVMGELVFVRLNADIKTDSRDTWDWQTGEKTLLKIDNLIQNTDIQFVKETVWSPDGNRVISVVKTPKGWAIATNGELSPYRFEEVKWLAFSPDSKHVFAAVKIQQGWRMLVDDLIWDEEFDHIGTILFTAGGLARIVGTSRCCRLVIFVRDQDEAGRIEMPVIFAYGDAVRTAAIVKTPEGWTVAVNGRPWEKSFDEVIDLAFSPDGEHVAVAVKVDNKWTTVVDGNPWRAEFEEVRYPIFSPDGKHVTVAVKVDNKWTTVVDGNPWRAEFEEVLYPIFSLDTQNASGKAKISRGWQTMTYDQMVEGDGNNVDEWEDMFNAKRRGMFNLPPFRKYEEVKYIVSPLSSGLGFGMAAIVKTSEGWTVAVNERPWEKSFTGVDYLTFSPDGKKVVAAVETSDGQATVAVDGKLWKTSFERVESPVFSEDSAHVVAIVNVPQGWTVALDGVSWNTMFGENILSVAVSPDGSRVAAVFQNEDRILLVVDDAVVEEIFGHVDEPIFSPTGDKLLIKAEGEGKYIRKVIAI